MCARTPLPPKPARYETFWSPVDVEMLVIEMKSHI